MDNYFSTRRSVRRYTDRNVSDEMLRDILSRAQHAPNTGNMQLYSVIVTRSKEGKEALAPAHFMQPAVTGCDVLLTVCLDINRFGKWCEQSGTSAGFSNFQAMVYSMIDATIFAQQIVTIAEMEGLGTCYMGTTTYNADKIAEVLRCPKGVVPVATITLGWPEEGAATSDRLPLDAVIHTEYYHNYTPDDIHRYYGPMEQTEENRKFIAENHKSTLAQVFAEVRYTRADNEHFSRVLYDFLVKQGFEFPA